MKIYNENEIKEALLKSLKKLYVKDYYLLDNNVHERSLTHKLAEYLQPLFPDYDVDCEYNLDIANESKRKKWVSDKAKAKLKSIIKNIKSEINPDSYDLSSEIEKLSVNFYPDIIIHKRGSNNHNLLIIEAKKKNSDYSFDEEKLTAFTNKKDKTNHYNYQLGAFIIFEVGKTKLNENEESIIYFKNGEKEK